MVVRTRPHPRKVATRRMISSSGSRSAMLRDRGVYCSKDSRHTKSRKIPSANNVTNRSISVAAQWAQFKSVSAGDCCTSARTGTLESEYQLRAQKKAESKRIRLSQSKLGRAAMRRAKTTGPLGLQDSQFCRASAQAGEKLVLLERFRGLEALNTVPGLRCTLEKKGITVPYRTCRHWYTTRRPNGAFFRELNWRPERCWPRIGVEGPF